MYLLLNLFRFTTESSVLFSQVVCNLPRKVENPPRETTRDKNSMMNRNLSGNRNYQRSVYA